MPLNKTPERGEYGERTELGTPSPTVLTLKERLTAAGSWSRSQHCAIFLR
jgi:hypothetical protein